MKKTTSKQSNDDSLLKSSDTKSNYNLGMTKRGLLEDEKEEESVTAFNNIKESDKLKEDLDKPDSDFSGDINLMTDESKRWLNTWNSALLLGVILLASLFTGFCCVYTVKNYTEGLAVMVLVIIMVSLFLEMVIIRPISVLIISLFYLCFKCCNKKQTQFKLDLNEDLNQSLEKSRGDIGGDLESQGKDKD